MTSCKHHAAAMAALTPEELSARQAYFANEHEIDEAERLIADGRRRLRAAKKLQPQLHQAWSSTPGSARTRAALYLDMEEDKRAAAPAAVCSLAATAA